LRDIKFIEVTSEIGAGTRGASLGIGAVKVASINSGSNFFRDYNAVEVETENEILFSETKTPYAKYIEQVYMMENRMCEVVSKVIKSDQFPFVLAGDHSTAAGTIAGIKTENPDKRLGVIWIDAHADLNTPYTTPSGNMHGMPLAMVADIDNLENKINEPSETTINIWNDLKNIGSSGAKINLEDIVFIAARALEKAEQELVNKYNITNFDTEQVREKGVENIVSETLNILEGCDIIYVSFDVDSIGSEISIGTGTPVPNGLTVDEAIQLNKLFVANEKVCAWEIVEVNPTLDTNNVMANSALKVMEVVREELENRL